MQNVPNYLKDYSDLWQKNPHSANLEWFKNAKWGMFIHYGLYSQLGKGEWIMYQDNPPIKIEEYEKLAETFDPKNFDADLITDLALEAEMKYVNLVTCHHDGFCLWKSDIESYNSYTTNKRDLVREMAEQCDKKGLGFFTYYTHMYNWRHPYAPPRDILCSGRPDYDFEDERYQWQGIEDFKKYWEYAHAEMTELLNLEYPLAGMWLDIIFEYYQKSEIIPIEETYKLIRDLRPEALIAYKQGATGTEDFASPEFSFNSQGDLLRKKGEIKAAEIADKAWNLNKTKHNEINMTLQHNGWGYVKDSPHYNTDDIWARLAYAHKNNCNMLANIGPLPDGSLPEEDILTLKETGRRIRENGYPKPEEAIDPDSWTKVKKDKNVAAAAE